MSVFAIIHIYIYYYIHNNAHVQHCCHFKQWFLTLYQVYVYVAFMFVFKYMNKDNIARQSMIFMNHLPNHFPLSNIFMLDEQV